MDPQGRKSPECLKPQARYAIYPPSWPTPRIGAQAPTSQWTKGNTADTLGPISPWLVTVFGVPFLVSYLSRCMSLQPGDLILTGTPPGVGLGQKPPVYLRPGQEVGLGVDGLGEQRQRVVA